MTSIDRNRAAQRSSELANKTASHGTSWLPAAVNRALKGYLKDQPEDPSPSGASPQDKKSHAKQHTTEQVKQDTFDELNKQADDQLAKDSQKLPPKPSQDDKRPPGDTRSAQQIINQSPLLKNLGNQDNIQQKLKDICGDYTKDADAAYRTNDLLMYFNKVDRGGKPAQASNGKDAKDTPEGFGEDLNNSSNHKIDGWTEDGEAVHTKQEDSEAARLQDFCRAGKDKAYATLADSGTQRSATPKDAASVSTQDIQKANPLFKDLPGKAREALKAKFGDIDKDTDAAAQAAFTLKAIKGAKAADGKQRPDKELHSGRIDGFDKQGNGAHATEAGRLQDFLKTGQINPPGDLRLDRPDPQAETDRRNSAVDTIQNYKIDTGDDFTSLNPEYRIEDIYAESQEKLQKIHHEARFGQDKDGNNLPAPPTRDGQRPEGDTRDAGALITSDEGADLDALIKAKEAGDSTASGLYTGLQKQVGDFANDPDATWRAIEVIKYLKTVNQDGDPYSPDADANGKPTENYNKSANGGTHLGFFGYTKRDKDANPNTPAGGIQDFCKYGYASLVGKENEKPTPEPEDMTAQDIQDANPILKNLGNQKGPDVELGLRDGLKAQVGDFDNDPNPTERKKAAARAVEVLEWIKGSTDARGEERDPALVGNGKLEGATDDGDVRRGTEAALLQDFNKHGISALKSDRALDETQDKHVFPDGTNKDNVQWASGEVAKYLDWFPGLGPALEGLGNSKDGQEALQAIGQAFVELGITVLGDLLVPGAAAADVTTALASLVADKVPGTPAQVKDIVASLQVDPNKLLKDYNNSQAEQEYAAEDEAVVQEEEKPAPVPKKSGEADESLGQGEERPSPAGRGAGRGAGSGDRSGPHERGGPQSQALTDLKAIPNDAFGKYPDDAGPELAGKNRPMWTVGTSRRNRSPVVNAVTHWKKHGKEMNLSPEEYVRKANDFAENPGKREHIRVDTSDPNSIFMGDMDTGEVVIIDKDGTVRTYFKLHNEKDNNGVNQTNKESFERAVNWPAVRDSSQNTTQS
jgi:hypothetical protein